MIPGQTDIQIKVFILIIQRPTPTGRFLKISISRRQSGIYASRFIKIANPCQKLYY